MAVDILAELGSRLSPQASIIQRDHADFIDLTGRWREWHAPEVNVVVKVATEGDVQETVSNILPLRPG
jgi:hypothetical protein